MAANNKQLELNKIQKEQRLGTIRQNNQGCQMKVVEYINTRNIKVQFLDEYKYIRKTSWDNFVKGYVINPYHKSVYDSGMLGAKYVAKIQGVMTKEYEAWIRMIERSCSNKFKENHPTYKDVTCCQEWLLFENFYEWIHSQENFDKWLNGDLWCLDKDILVKGNKIYSPETCCLVPRYVNNIVLKCDAARGHLPIGIHYYPKMDKYCGLISMIKNNKKYKRNCGYYPTPEDAFYLGYKPTKERYIQKIAQEEYDLGNITKRCYEAMMNYKVEITD